MVAHDIIAVNDLKDTIILYPKLDCQELKIHIRELGKHSDFTSFEIDGETMKKVSFQFSKNGVAERNI